MGKRGFQPHGTPNPLLARNRSARPPQPSDRSIRNHLSRPRPTLEEVKSAVALKEAKSRRMAEYEGSQTKDHRKELDDYREKVMKREAKRKRKEARKRRKMEKKGEDKEAGQKTGGGSPVQLSKFFSFVGDGDVSDGEIPPSDDEETEPSKTTTTASTHATDIPTNNTTTTTTATATATSESDGPPRSRRKRWDEKPAIFQNQEFPTTSSSTTTPVSPSPLQLPFLSFPTLFTPINIQPNFQLLQQIQIQQHIQQQIQVSKMQHQQHISFRLATATIPPLPTPLQTQLLHATPP